MACTITPEDKVILQARLDEAKQAYHDLLTGTKARVIVDQNGERVRYASSNAADLLRYINWLRDLLGMCPFGIMRPSRPAGVLF